MPDSPRPGGAEPGPLPEPVPLAGRAAETALMLRGYGLTTAQFLYRFPDHPHLLQTYLWQDYDLAPRFPKLFGFIEFWKAKLDGPLHSVRYTHRRLIRANEWRSVTGEFVLH